MAAVKKAEGERAGEESGEETCVYAGKESVSPGAGCASLRGGSKGERDCPVGPPRQKRGAARKSSAGQRLRYLFFFFRNPQESSGSASDSPLHACLKWTEEGWMPAGLRVLETQVTAVSFLFHFFVLYAIAANYHCLKVGCQREHLSCFFQKLLRFMEFVM